eukprot:gene22283-29360_t
MIPSINPVTLLGANGRIWTEKPKAGKGGLVACFQTPSMPSSSSVRPSSLVVAALDPFAHHLGAVDSKGAVYVLNLRENRYARLDDKVGHPGSAVVFAPDNLRQVFVAFSDCTIRCYDTAKNVVPWKGSDSWGPS